MQNTINKSNGCAAGGMPADVNELEDEGYDLIKEVDWFINGYHEKDTNTLERVSMRFKELLHLIKNYKLGTAGIEFTLGNYKIRITENFNNISELEREIRNRINLLETITPITLKDIERWEMTGQEFEIIKYKGQMYQIIPLGDTVDYFMIEKNGELNQFPDELNGIEVYPLEAEQMYLSEIRKLDRYD